MERPTTPTCVNCLFCPTKCQKKKKIYPTSHQQNGVVSALPYVASTTLALLFSMAMDRATARGLLSVLAVRRLAMAVGEFGCDS